MSDTYYFHLIYENDTLPEYPEYEAAKLLYGNLSKLICKKQFLGRIVTTVFNEIKNADVPKSTGRDLAVRHNVVITGNIEFYEGGPYTIYSLFATVTGRKL